MQLSFYKYQGTGNDFILIDNRDGSINLSTEQVFFLCDRRFGIGADGLMLLETAEGYDFKMVYYNSDGNTSTMCGNGGRCIAAFAKKLGIIDAKANFIATDGPHEAQIDYEGLVSLHMKDVTDITYRDGNAILDTGSPHYIKWVNDVYTIDVYNEGRAIRNGEDFQPKGINVNFVHRIGDNEIAMRTYERGVEDETLSCGTGVTAAALAANTAAEGKYNTRVNTKGGVLHVAYTKLAPAHAVDVVLSGAATFVYEGVITLPEYK